MVRRLNHDFVRADSVHFVKETFPFAVQFALDTQRGKFVWLNSNAPARRIWASAIPSVDENFRRSSSFIARAERAILLFSGDDALSQEVVRPLPSLRRNDHPSARDRVLTQLRQSNPPRICSGSPAPREQPGDFELYSVWRPGEDVPVGPLLFEG